MANHYKEDKLSATLCRIPDPASLSEFMNSSDNDDLVARIEDDPIAQSLGSRSRFIPLRHRDLCDDLIQRYRLLSQQRAEFLSICAKLQQIFHAEHLSQLLQLEEIYSPLDPDSQIVELDEGEEDERGQLTEKLFDRVSGLLYSAHYKRLNRDELERAVEVASQWNVRLDVDFELYDRLEVFARGYHAVTVKRRKWKNFFREEKIELPEFERLFLAFRLKQPKVKSKPVKEEQETKKSRRAQLASSISSFLAGDDDDAMSFKYVYLKTFKNIPETDLEVLLPGSKVKLSMLDRGKILLPTALAFFKISRLVAVLGAVIVAAASAKHLFDEVVDEVLALVLVASAIIGYIIKSVLSYLRTKDKYQFGLTKNLYLKNLGNNSGVIYRILNEAEEQELLETILGYSVLWQAEVKAKRGNRAFDGLTSKELDRDCEQYLIEVAELNVDFEVDDSLGKLARLGLAHVDKNGRWTAVPIEQAGDCLDASWKRLFQARGMRVEFDPAERMAQKQTKSALPESDLFTS